MMLLYKFTAIGQIQVAKKECGTSTNKLRSDKDLYLYIHLSLDANNDVETIDHQPSYQSLITDCS